MGVWTCWFDFNMMTCNTLMNWAKAQQHICLFISKRRLFLLPSDALFGEPVWSPCASPSLLGWSLHSCWYSWLGFRHPFATIWLSRRSGLARLSSHLQIEIWMSLDHVIWPRLWPVLSVWLCPILGQSHLPFEIQIWGARASPRHKQEIRTHEFLVSHSLLILWTKSDSYLIPRWAIRRLGPSEDKITQAAETRSWPPTYLVLYMYK